MMHTLKHLTCAFGLAVALAAPASQADLINPTPLSDQEVDAWMHAEAVMRERIMAIQLEPKTAISDDTIRLCAGNLTGQSENVSYLQKIMYNTAIGHDHRVQLYTRYVDCVITLEALKQGVRLEDMPSSIEKAYTPPDPRVFMEPVPSDDIPE